MKRIALISSYCDNDEKIEVLSNNIDTIKSLGIDVMLNSPIPLPIQIIKKCDYFFLTKDNPVLNWPIKSSISWYAFPTYGKDIKLCRSLPDFGWANIYQVKKLSQISLTLDYDYFYHIIYDLDINDDVKNDMLSDKKCNFFHFHEWNVSLHFMIFDRENLSKFSSAISYEQYITDGNIAEPWLDNFIRTCGIDYKVEDRYIDEKIHYYTGKNLFNYSKIPNVHYFITKDIDSKCRIYFYHIGEPIVISVTIDEVTSEYNISNLDFIDIDRSSQVILQYNGVSYDISDDILSVVFNTFELL